jgi:hypothetical protein
MTNIEPDRTFLEAARKAVAEGKTEQEFFDNVDSDVLGISENRAGSIMDAVKRLKDAGEWLLTGRRSREGSGAQECA